MKSCTSDSDGVRAPIFTETLSENVKSCTSDNDDVNFMSKCEILYQ